LYTDGARTADSRTRRSIAWSGRAAEAPVDGATEGMTGSLPLLQARKQGHFVPRSADLRPLSAYLSLLNLSRETEAG
jgi:hypothetical protein